MSWVVISSIDTPIVPILSGGLTFALCLFLKTLLDLNLAPKLVRYLHWLPVRNYFREKPISIKGLWEQKWEASSTSFALDVDRHSNVEIKQLGSHCYGEFSSKRVKYCVFGRIEGGFFMGTWYDAKDKLGYFGTFQLRIVSGSLLVGRWMGHSNKSHEIKHGEWKWERIDE
jgi:hypothetical protein